VIPFTLVKDQGLIQQVPLESRAHPLAIEYRIEALPRGHFDILEFEGW
jgi:hypothetical protein